MIRKGSWIQTYTGVAFYPLDPRLEDFRIEDIAHSLSLQCRFTGHCREFYSVAEHSVRLSYIVPPAAALWGLMHDASEAYLMDLARPIKRYSALGALYKEIEIGLMASICEAFHLQPDEPLSVGLADRVMLVTEKRDLLGPEPQAWTHHDTPLEETIKPWPPVEAKARFLSRFAELAHQELAA